MGVCGGSGGGVWAGLVGLGVAGWSARVIRVGGQQRAHVTPFPGARTPYRPRDTLSRAPKGQQRAQARGISSASVREHVRELQQKPEASPFFADFFLLSGGPTQHDVNFSSILQYYN